MLSRAIPPRPRCPVRSARLRSLLPFLALVGWVLVTLPSAGEAAGTVVRFGGRNFVVSQGPPGFESAAIDGSSRFASQGFLYDACGNSVSAGPTEAPGLAWDPTINRFWQITSNRVVRRWLGGTVVDTVFTIPLTFTVPGAGLDTLESPRGIAVDANHVYVVDAGPHPGEIASNAWFKFTRTGAPVKSSRTTDFIQHLDADPDALVDDIVYAPASSPVFPGKLLIALEHSGIQVVNTEGNYVARFRWSDDPSYDPVRLAAFAGLAIDSSGNLYLVDNDQGRAEVWTLLPPGASRAVVGVAGGHAVLQHPNAGCNHRLWRPISTVAGAPTLIFGVAYRTLDGMVYGYDYATGELWKLDPLSGAGARVDPAGLTDTWGLAYNAAQDVLYGSQDDFVANSSRIHVIDPDDGTEQALPNPVGFFLNDIAYDPLDGKIYGNDYQSLIRIDPVTGMGTLVGATGRFYRGMDWDASTQRLLATTNGPCKLWSVNPSTASGVLVADLPRDYGWEGLAVFGTPGVTSVAGTLETPDSTAASPEASTAFRVTPNPTTGGVEIQFTPGMSPHDLEIVDVAGRRVRTLSHGTRTADGRWWWNGRDDEGRPVAPGVYWVRGHANTRSPAERIIVTR